MKRRQRLMPPDLTSLFDVLFIVVFAALIRAAAAQKAPPPEPVPVVTPPPAPPPDVAALHDQALADLAARRPLVLRVSADGVLHQLEADGKDTTLDAPLLEHVPDPDIAIAYLGDRSADLHVCKQAALHLGVVDLRPYLVIIAPDAPLADLPHALFDGLRRDADRCLADAGAVAVVVDQAEMEKSK